MARKDLLKGLIDQDGDDGTKSPPSTPPLSDKTSVNMAKPRYSSGAIGVVSQSIADLKAKSVVDIDPNKITAGGLVDRLEYDDASFDALKQSLEDYGQQVPILVRPHPEQNGQYEIVYGRRRVIALRELGVPAKALIKDLTNKELVLAQGQENSARKDLTYIEKATFAGAMVAEGYARKIICDALSIDKSAISKMLHVMGRIPATIIQAIGPANNVGRDRWMALAEHMTNVEGPPEEYAERILNMSVVKQDIDRFEIALDILGLQCTGSDQTQKSKPKLAPTKRTTTQQITSVGGREKIATVYRRDTTVTLTLPKTDTGGFEDWLIANLRGLHAQWENDLVGEMAQDAANIEQTDKTGGTV